MTWIRDERCQRGLKYTCRLDAPIDAPALLDRLDAAVGHRLVRATETWGSTTVHRAILMFRFEIHLIEDDRAVQLHHRVSAPPLQREEDRQLVAALLAETV